MRIHERRGLEAIAVDFYYPRRLRRRHFFHPFSRDLWRFKRGWDPGLIGRFARELAAVVREAGWEAEILTYPPPSRPRLYYPTAHLAQAVAVELDLDCVDCLEWKELQGSQGARQGWRKLKRLHEVVECKLELAGLRVLLVDDLLTTGLTAAVCQEGLLAAGASRVFIAVLGWTCSEDPGGFRRVRLRRKV